MNLKQINIGQLLFFYCLFSVVPAVSQSTEIEPMEKITVQSVTVNLTPEEAFKFFTENQKLEGWLTAKANVQPEVGGPYELFWEPDDPENNSTIGCRILAIDAPHYLNFEWKGPKQYKYFMNTADPLTNVTVLFSPVDEKTKITLLHTGWKSGENWEEARTYFENAWKKSMERIPTLIN